MRYGVMLRVAYIVANNEIPMEILAWLRRLVRRSVRRTDSPLR